MEKFSVESNNPDDIKQQESERMAEERKIIKRRNQREAINELFYPIKYLTEQLQERLESAEYSHVIGDDSSGRIPTLIIKDVIEKIYENNGSPQLTVRFLAGSRYANDPVAKKDTIGEYLDKEINPPTGKRVLIVTDVIDTGSGLIPLTQALKEKGIIYDVATLFMYEPNHKLQIEDKLGGKIILGSQDTFHTPRIFKSSEYSGVEKNPDDLHAKKFADNPEAQETVNNMRVLAKEAAEDIYHLYLNKKRG
jgi:hypoxanthine-guanine phosphoribosyltransferase